VLLIELGAVEAILGRHRQKSEAAQKHELARSYLNLFLEQFSRDSLDFLRKATHYFIEAKDLDETLAEAHSGLAACYTAAGIYNITRPEESFGSALGPAKRALELNDRLAEAYTSLAYAYMCYTWDWLAAEAEYRRALGIDPDHVTALQGLAHWLAAMGRFRESLEEIDRAREVAPESIMVNVVRGFILYYGRDYEESWKQFLKAIDLNPHFDAAYYGLALACEPLALSYMEKGNAEEATRMFEKAARAARKAVRLSHGNPVKLAAQAHVHALSGDEDRAQRELQQLIALSTEEYVSPFQIATIFAAMVTTCNALEKSNLAVEYYEQALKYLDLAYRTRDQWLVLLNVEPRFTILHEDERFKDLIRKLNFPPAARAGEGADAGQADHQGAGVGER
jgi:tetratricopeptide (TPR) repeat protein